MLNTIGKRDDDKTFKERQARKAHKKTLRHLLNL